MKRIILPKLLIISLLFISCKNNNTPDNKSTDSFKNDSLRTSQIILHEFLTKKEKDSILNNWEHYLEEDSKIKYDFSLRAQQRKQEIQKIKEYTVPYHDYRIPFKFKRFLLPEELAKFNPDSISSWLVNIDLVNKRQELLIAKIPMRLYLNETELQSFIRNGMQNADSVNIIVNKRNEERLNTYNRELDSLRNVIYPINSTLPFGSPVLLRQLNNGVKHFEFSKDVNEPITDSSAINNRKTIHDIWNYYAEIARNVPDIEPYGYLPPIVSNELLSLNKEQNEDFDYLFHEETEYFKTYNTFEFRIENIGIYEVYVSFLNPSFSCGFRNIENCCFSNSGCNSSGYLTLYNRETRTAKSISAIYLFGNAFRFFTIEENGIIKLFEGRGTTDRVNFDGRERKGTLFFEAYLTHTINVLDNGNITIKKDDIVEQFGY